LSLRTICAVAAPQREWQGWDAPKLTLRSSTTAEAWSKETEKERIIAAMLAADSDSVVAPRPTLEVALLPACQRGRGKLTNARPCGGM
jgi:hypothetical protein